MRVFLDTNVLLDVFLKRVGAPASAAAITACGEAGNQAFVAVHTLSNAFYLIEKQRSRADAWDAIRDMLAWADVARTSKADALWAVQSGMNDFEDALQLSAAISCAADVVITRNTTDFKSSAIVVMTPEDFLAAHP